jgi:hypothetical protein
MRYYFDMRDSDGLVIDEEGVELPTLAAAQEEAARSLADMARDADIASQKQNALEMAVEVRDNVGLVLQAKFCFELVRLDS